MFKPKMPPPSKPALEIAIAAGPKAPADAQKPEGEGAKASDTDAIVLRAGDKICGTCAHYQGESGECMKVEGIFDPEDRCLRFYKEKGADEERGESPDMQEAEGEAEPMEMGR